MLKNTIGICIVLLSMTACSGRTAPTQGLQVPDQQWSTAYMVKAEPMIAVRLVSAPFVDVMVPEATNELRAGWHTISAGKGQLSTADGIVLGSSYVLSTRGGARPPVLLRRSIKNNEHQSFRGDIRILAVNNRVEVGEVVAMEHYLEGVLSAELGARVAPAALEAQAVAARSYALTRYLARKNEPWNIEGSTADQDYKGIPGFGADKFQRAVSRSRGLVLTWHNQPVPAYFSAASGGKTESPDNVWPERFMPDGVSKPSVVMTSVYDPDAEAGAALWGNPAHWEWTCTIPLKELGQVMETHVRGRDITDVKNASYSITSQRVMTVDLILADGTTVTVPGTILKSKVGGTRLRSLLWTSYDVKDGVLNISGRGYGHGVGMSQISAWAMAHRGESHEAILARFYPGATLERWW
jgi:SpoIID/LytB domain protein